MRHDPTFWILARASGLCAYGLLTCSALAGLVLKSRPFGTRVKPATVTDLHRFLSLLALSSIAVHGVALVLDTTIRVTPQALLVPGLVPYRPLWTGLGVVAADLAAVVYVSFSLRKRIGTRNWRRLHWTTYGIFASATAHGLMSGTDSGAAWARDAYLGAIGALVAATTWRILVPPARPERKPRPEHVPAPDAPRTASPEPAGAR